MRCGAAADERELRSIVDAGRGGVEESLREADAAGGAYPLADKCQQEQHNPDERKC